MCAVLHSVFQHPRINCRFLLLALCLAVLATTSLPAHTQDPAPLAISAENESYSLGETAHILPTTARLAEHRRG